MVMPAPVGHHIPEKAGGFVTSGMPTATQPWFVNEASIVRKIWGNADTILFIFAGSAAEFALNRAVDWLYFTGRLPADPLGRLFSTVAYARLIVFSPTAQANAAIDRITAIHGEVEAARHATIPDWAYRDVLYMLIYYSVASYELLERRLNDVEKEEVYNVFLRVGQRMGLPGLPASYADWLYSRGQHLSEHLVYSEHSKDLYRQYRKHLGGVRFTLLWEVQKMLLPGIARRMLRMNQTYWLRPAVPLYRLMKKLGMDTITRYVLVPAAYRAQVAALRISAK